jgi:hypothetical protein
MKFFAAVFGTFVVQSYALDYVFQATGWDPESALLEWFPVEANLLISPGDIDLYSLEGIIDLLAVSGFVMIVLVPLFVLPLFAGGLVEYAELRKRRKTEASTTVQTAPETGDPS